MPVNVVQYKQVDEIAHGKTSGLTVDEQELLDSLRRAHLAAARAIEKYMAKRPKSNDTINRIIGQHLTV